MMRKGWLLLAIGVLVLGGCVMVPRRPPPPRLIDAAAPAGFESNVRLVALDRERYTQKPAYAVEGPRNAARGQPINILVLSGGGSDGAFGAGALIGLTKSHALPKFQLVTGASAGALLAPFAFLGPDWNAQLRKVFTSGALESLQPSGEFSLLKRIVFPQGVNGHDALTDLVDRFITDAMIKAVARQARTGRQLWVATTDIDNAQTVFWNMGAIAERGSPAAYKLFRKILVASASIPGVFPPVLIEVTENGKTYDEMYVDACITTPMFLAPVVTRTARAAKRLVGANVYVMVNGHMRNKTAETPISTIRIVARSFSALLSYNKRRALAQIVAFAHRAGMHLHFTALPDAYRFGSALDFHRKHLRKLFDYGESCAERGLLWTSVAHGVQRNAYRSTADSLPQSPCPSGTASTYRTELAQQGRLP